MKVKELIADAMRLIGRGDAADSYGEDSADEETARVAYTLLFCYNAVIDELSRRYFPVVEEETLTAEDGLIALSAFAHVPVKILQVTSADGKRRRWRAELNAVRIDGDSAKIQYAYAPDRAEEDDSFAYPDGSVGAGLVMCGMAAEYFLIQGETECAEIWETRYRAEIERTVPLSFRPLRMPARRWV